MELSRFFTLPELTFSNTATAKGIANQPGDTELDHLRALCMAVLDPLRASLGQAIKVTSGYRSPELNRLIGAAKSQHQEGKAADLQAPGMPTLELFKSVIRQALPFDQVIYEPKSETSKWVHVSHDAVANRGQILVAAFGVDGKARYTQLTAQQALDMQELVSRSARFPQELDYDEISDEPEQEPPSLTSRSPHPARTKPSARSRQAPKTALSATSGAGAKRSAGGKAVSKQATAMAGTTKKVAAKVAASAAKAVKRSSR